MISDCLNNEFSFFFEDFTIKEQSANFYKFTDSTIDLTINVKSRVKIILKNKMQFPHEATESEFDFIEFKKKYLRRIERFNLIVRSADYKKIFVRADNRIISESDKHNLQNSLVKYGAINFEIKFISYESYPVKGEFLWQRSYIDWKNFFYL